MGFRRCCLVADRCFLASRRRTFDPRVGLVRRRTAGPRSSPRATASASFARAISRLRSWDRCSDAVTTSDPAIRRCPRRWSSIARCSSDSTAECATFQDSATRLSVVFTCCPPGPEEREKRQTSSEAGIVSAGDTDRSMAPASHECSLPASGAHGPVVPAAKLRTDRGRDLRMPQ